MNSTRQKSCLWKKKNISLIQLLKLCFALAFGLLFCSLSFAQDQLCFSIFEVQVLVKDENGSVLPNAQVIAFSQDWGVQVPRAKDAFMLSTDVNGICSLNLFGGKWSIFAYGGSAYADAHLGHGLFAFTNDIYVTSDTAITIQPDASLNISLYDKYGALIGIDMLLATQSKYAPAIRTTVCGKSLTGEITLHSMSNSKLDVLLVKKTSETQDGYILTYKNVTCPGTLVGNPNIDNNSVLFKSFDGNLNPTLGDVEVRFPTFDADAGFNISFSVWSESRVHFSSDTVVFSYRFILTDWYMYFSGAKFSLSGNMDDTISFGGPFSGNLNVIPKGAEHFPPATQLWFDIRDYFGNVLIFHGSDYGEKIPFTVTRSGDTLFSDSLPGRYTSIPSVYDTTEDIEFCASLYYGPFGTINLQGELFDMANRYILWGYESEHFRFNVPIEFQEKASQMLPKLEEMYDIMAQLVGFDIPEIVDINIDVTGQGFPGEYIPLKTPLIVFINTDYLFPPSFPFMYHEMGHVRLLKPPLYFNAPMEFGEPYPTLLGYKVIQTQMDSLLALRLMGGHDKIFYYLQGEPISDVYDLIETVQFVLFYLERYYGWAIHSSMLSKWNNEFVDWRSELYSLGLNGHEVMTVLYSCLADTNLYWLFHTAGLSLDSSKVALGIQTVCPETNVDQDVSPTSIKFNLGQNHPNPFNPITEIRYDLSKPCHVKLVVYNILGQTIRTLLNKKQSHGCYTAFWDGKDEKGKDVASGIYFYQLKASDFTETKKMLLLK